MLALDYLGGYPLPKSKANRPMGPSRRVLVLAMVVASAVVLSGCLVPRPPGDGSLRYRDLTFSGVTVTRDLQYGSAP